MHSAIERQLGEVGRKIHAGRSRNDQVAAALRLYVLDAAADAREEIDALALVILSFAEAEADTLMPGYTHLQRGQPVTLGHHLLAWVEMLDRDRGRFAHAAEAAAASPLGAGALAGSTLGLPAPAGQMRNSIDAVADRDFALDYLYAATVLFTHLSRIGEELVLWSTAEFGFARLPETAATGSSMMPQKLNPDVAELTRGKAGTAIGRLTGLLATVKGLPLAYDRDLQEDKSPVFATRRDVRLALQALTVLVSGLEVSRERLAEAASDPLLLATDAAEALVRDGVPFREAHERVAASVRDGTYERGRRGGRQRCGARRDRPGRGSRGDRRSPPPLRRQPVAAAAAARRSRRRAGTHRPCPDRLRRAVSCEGSEPERVKRSCRSLHSRLRRSCPRRTTCDARSRCGVDGVNPTVEVAPMKRIAVVAGLLLAAAALAGVLRPEGAGAVDPVPTTDTVTVSGTGSVSAVPDQAEVSAGVETRGATAQAALDANAAAMRKVIAAVRAAGGKDVTTQTVSLSAAVDPEGREVAGNGFVATNVVSAKIDLADAGKLIDAAVAAGANTVWGPDLSYSDPAKLYREALAKSVADARERATCARHGGRPPARGDHDDDRGRLRRHSAGREGRSRRRGNTRRLRAAGHDRVGDRHVRARADGRMIGCQARRVARREPADSRHSHVLSPAQAAAARIHRRMRPPDGCQP